MNVFVTGGTGFVGRNVIRALKAAHHMVYAWVRHGSEVKLPFLDGVEIVFGDSLEPQEMRIGMEKCDAVINLVGIIREYPRKGITFDQTHYQSTLHTVNIAKKCGVKRFIQMSANGASDHGVSVYQTTKRRAERIVEESGLDWTIFRPSVIFGDPEGLFEFSTELAGIIRSFIIIPIFDGGKLEMDPVWVGDVADCFVKALNTPISSGKTFHLCGGRPIKFKQIVETIGKAIGKKRIVTMPIPFGLILPVASVMERFSFFPVTSDQLLMLKQGNICKEQEFKAIFGIQPKQFISENLDYLGLDGY